MTVSLQNVSAFYGFPIPTREESTNKPGKLGFFTSNFITIVTEVEMDVFKLVKFNFFCVLFPLLELKLSELFSLGNCRFYILNAKLCNLADY